MTYLFREPSFNSFLSLECNVAKLWVVTLITEGVVQVSLSTVKNKIFSVEKKIKTTTAQHLTFTRSIGQICKGVPYSLDTQYHPFLERN